MVTMVVVVVVVVLGPAPKWNDKGRMRKGCQGRGRIQPMGSTYPVFVGIAGRRWRWTWRTHALEVNPMVRMSVRGSKGHSNH